MPMPPPTSTGRSTSSRNPWPSGPKTWTASPRPSLQSDSVPGPTGSIRKASSPAGARQSESARGRSRPGASSMKNWPGDPGSTPPRSKRSSVYGPTGSAPATRSSSRRGSDTDHLHLDPLLERERVLVPRGSDRMHPGSSARERRDARDTRCECGFANRVTVRASVPALGRVQDEIATALANEVDDGLAFVDLLDIEARDAKRLRGAARRHEREAEPGERGGHRNERGLISIAHREERRPVRRKRPSRRTLRFRERRREVAG